MVALGLWAAAVSCHAAPAIPDGSASASPLALTLRSWLDLRTLIDVPGDRVAAASDELRRDLARDAAAAGAASNRVITRARLMLALASNDLSEAMATLKTTEAGKGPLARLLEGFVALEADPRKASSVLLPRLAEHRDDALVGLAGMLAAAKLAAVDPHAALDLYKEVRLRMPGTSLELEAFLGEAAVLARVGRAPDSVRRLATMSRRAPGVPPSITRIRDVVRELPAHLDGTSWGALVPALDEFAIISEPAHRLVLLELAGEALLRGNLPVARLAAGRVISAPKLSEGETARAQLYLAAAGMDSSERREPVILTPRQRAALSAIDAAIHDIVQAVGTKADPSADAIRPTPNQATREIEAGLRTTRRVEARAQSAIKAAADAAQKARP